MRIALLLALPLRTQLRRQASEGAHELQFNTGQFLFSRAWKEAEALLREVLAGKSATLGQSHISTLITLETLAGLLRHLSELALTGERQCGDLATPLLDEAEALLRVALAAVLMQNSSTCRMRFNLAYVKETRGRRREAEVLLSADLAVRLAADPACPFTAFTAEALARHRTEEQRARGRRGVGCRGRGDARAPLPF